MADTASPSPDMLLRTPLYDTHVALGARMVPFAGYAMPVQYPSGIIAEHTATRMKAGLFDVSHMGQAHLEAADFDTAARALEHLVPSDVFALKPGRARYSVLVNETGGIIDDLIISRPESDGPAKIMLVVNAANKHADYAHIRAHLPADVQLVTHDTHALLALQGPEAEAVLSAILPGVERLSFMETTAVGWNGTCVGIARSGYTGEDGFEISVDGTRAPALWAALTADTRVTPVGLGARDSLRLEAGLCLHGHDIDATTDPVEAGLTWVISKRRRIEGGFPGAHIVLMALADGAPYARVGIAVEGRAPVREGAEIYDADGTLIGRVTSGGFSPTLSAPIAMGYVRRAHAAPGAVLTLRARGRESTGRVADLPLVPHRYKRS